LAPRSAHHLSAHDVGARLSGFTSCDHLIDLHYSGLRRG
jgi:hypothetical protein